MMDVQLHINLVLISLFLSLILFGLETGTMPALGGFVSISFDRETQPKRFWLLMTAYAIVVIIGCAAVLGLVD
jgi:hypothetical protein